MFRRKDKYRPLSYLALISIQLALPGCHTVEISNPDTFSRTYFGYVHLNVDRSEKKRHEYVSNSTIVGASFNDGIEIGYINTRILSIPLDCRIVVIVSNNEQYEQASNLLQLIQKGASGCVISQTK